MLRVQIGVGTLCSIIAKNKIPSRARFSLTALEPSAIPSARAWIQRPMVVLEVPVGVKADDPDGIRSIVGDDGSADRGIGDSGLPERSNGGRNVRRCMTRYPDTNASAIGR